MRLTKEEKEICKKYSTRDEDGFVHCRECLLTADRRYAMCKRNMTAQEWREHLEWGKEH